MKKVLFIASNYGLWAEELQAPWDAVKKAGFEAVLATHFGRKPNPFKVSVDPELIDPVQNYKVNPIEVVERVKAILKTGEWDNPIRTDEAKAEDYAAIIGVGGPGAPLDITGSPGVHRLLYSAYKHGKILGAVCYAVGAFAFTRDPENNNKSIVYGKTVAAHPHSWDFDFDLGYELLDEKDDKLNLITPGFVYPLQYMMEDAVGPEGQVIADETANRNKPCVTYDAPFLTALSVESSIAFGEKLVELLKQDQVDNNN